MSKVIYKVRNWSAYTKGVKSRGDISIWLCRDNLKGWCYSGPQKRGGKTIYSDTAIELCLVVKVVFHLPLRQVEGFIRSIFALSHINLPVPDYSLICRRSAGLAIDFKLPGAKKVSDLVVDTTGLTLYGEGEWKVRLHGWGKYRSWMKLHVALDEDEQQVEAVALTADAVDDAATVEDLLEQISRPVRCLKADGSYDRCKVRAPLHERGILQLIPPDRRAVVDKRHRDFLGERDQDIRFIAQKGKLSWKICTNYFQRNKAETFIARYKTIVGSRLIARKPGNQQSEVLAAVKTLNRMLQLAKPVSQRFL